MEYGCWSCKGEDINVGKPIALILFSGRSRPGDLHNQLVNLGWIVCSVDMAAPIKTNLLDDGIWEKILADIRLGMYEAVWVATPCGSFSPLRENQPGPSATSHSREDTGQAQRRAHPRRATPAAGSQRAG